MKDYPFIENCCFANNNIILPKLVNFEEKDLLHRFHLLQGIKKTQRMFEYEDLPEKIPYRQLELFQQSAGFVIIFELNGDIHFGYAGLGGVPDFNYLPTVATYSNPILGSHMFNINWGYESNVKNNVKTEGDCVVIPNDSLFMGLLPVHSYYASQLVENDLSINCNLINTRLLNILVATDDNGQESLQDIIDDLKKGKLSSAVDKNWLADGIKSLPFGTGASSNALIQLLEHRQYVKGSWWNELGVQSNYNMKRETITSSENILNVDSLLPVSDDMLKMRRDSWKLANKIFGTNVKVDFSSSWRKIQSEIKLKEEMQLKELKEENKGMSTQVDNKPKENTNDKTKDN